MTRAGFAAVIGAPNAGKSTLVNRLVGAKVSIVTQKVQTTRFPVRGVALWDDSQIVLVDTPGIFAPRRRLDRAMVRAAWSRAAEADCVVHLVDAHAEVAVADGGGRAADRRSAHDVKTITEGLAGAAGKAILALNKIDLLPRTRLLSLSQTLFSSEIYAEVFMIDAVHGSGVEDLKRRLAELMPPGPWLYPADQTADLPTAVLAAEITREKVYLRLHQELPYAIAVETSGLRERPDGSLRLDQTIYVERDRQKAIVVGRGGETLKWIGKAAREELTQSLARPVHLFLHVKVRSGWAEERGFYGGLGLDLDE